MASNCLRRAETWAACPRAGERWSAGGVSGEQGGKEEVEALKQRNEAFMFHKKTAPQMMD
jgi:hypothetical protein